MEINRQYIGARYVPKFYEGSNGTEWDANHIYEALTIVTYLGNSYTSKKSVPASVGNPMENPTYWAATGNYNAQVEEYREEVADALEEVADAVEEVERLVNPDRRIIVISDSYGLGRNDTTAFTTYLQQYLGLTSSDYYTWSEGSMGFNRTGDMGHVAQTLLAAHVADVTNPETITDVMFAMGANDILATSGLLDAITDCVAYAKTQFVNAKIHIAFIGNIKVKANSTEYGNYITALHSYKTACGLTDAKYASGGEFILHNASLLQADGVHPTSTGSSEIAKFLRAYLNGTPYEYAYFGTITLTGNATFGFGVHASGGITEMILAAGSAFTVETSIGRTGTVVATNASPCAYVVAVAPLVFNAFTYDGTNFVPITLKYQGGTLTAFCEQSITVPIGSAIEGITMASANTLTV